MANFHPIISPPKYVQVSDYIKGNIESGEYPVGSKLASEEQYVKMFHVSRGTVRQAIKDLEFRGMVETQHGKGTFVVRKYENRRATYLSFFIPDEYGFDVFGNSFYLPILCCLERIAKLYHIKIVFSSYSKEELQDPDPSLVEHVGDGCFFTRNIPEHVLHALQERNIPYVFIGNAVSGNLDYSIMADNLQGAYLATKHLISLGHRRILHLTHDTTRMTGQMRLEGYQKALEESGIPVDDALILPCISRQTADIRAALESFLGSTNFTAVFAGSDHRAIVAMDFFREKGYRIPEDISIVGFDNLSISAQPVYSLTTVDVNKELMAEKAMAMMLDRLKGNEVKHKSVTIPVSMIIRGSSR